MMVKRLEHLGNQNVPSSEETKTHQDLTQHWNKKEHGNIFVAKKAGERKMQEINQDVITDRFDETRNDQATKCNQEWYNLCKQEEIFWTQKSRV